jgi:hypothetical protein
MDWPLYTILLLSAAVMPSGTALMVHIRPTSSVSASLFVVYGVGAFGLAYILAKFLVLPKWDQHCSLGGLQ